MSEQNNKTRKKAGAVWVKTSKAGKYLSLEIELNGKKYNYVGFANSYKQPGDNKPSYNLFEAEPRTAVSKPATETHKSAPSADELI